jgi:hypothetical protein
MWQDEGKEQTKRRDFGFDGPYGALSLPDAFVRS